MADDPVSDFDWLIHMLVDVVTRDGNLLLNVGPDKNGHIRPDVAERMRQIGAWLRENGDTIYKTRGGPIEPVDHVYGTTYRENEIFLHILDTEETKYFRPFRMRSHPVLTKEKRFALHRMKRRFRSSFLKIWKKRQIRSSGSG